MEGARVAVIEDREQLRQMMCMLLEHHGHEVVAEAGTLEEALSLVDAMAEGFVEVDVVLLDGNLQPAAELGDDARQVSERIRERSVGAAILGFSAGSMAQYGVEVTADPGKDPIAVVEAIAAL